MEKKTLIKQFHLLFLILSINVACKKNSSQSSASAFKESNTSESYQQFFLNHAAPPGEACLPLIDLKDVDCKLMQFMVEIPEGGGGHSAMVVGDQFYDYGPVSTADNNTFGARDSNLPLSNFDLPFSIISANGGPFWDNPQYYRAIKNRNFPIYTSPNEIKLKDIIFNAEKIVGNAIIAMIPIYVKATHAKAIQDYWEAIYKEYEDANNGGSNTKAKPIYSVPGTHCTSVSERSFEITDDQRPWRSFVHENTVDPTTTRTPFNLARLLLANMFNEAQVNYTHRCGSLRGQKLKSVIVSGPGKSADVNTCAQYSTEDLATKYNTAAKAERADEVSRSSGEVEVWFGVASSPEAAAAMDNAQLRKGQSFFLTSLEGAPWGLLNQMLDSSLKTADGDEASRFVYWKWQTQILRTGIRFLDTQKNMSDKAEAQKWCEDPYKISMKTCANQFLQESSEYNSCADAAFQPYLKCLDQFKVAHF